MFKNVNKTWHGCQIKVCLHFGWLNILITEEELHHFVRVVKLLGIKGREPPTLRISQQVDTEANHNLKQGFFRAKSLKQLSSPSSWSYILLHKSLDTSTFDISQNNLKCPVSQDIKLNLLEPPLSNKKHTSCFPPFLCALYQREHRHWGNVLSFYDE